MKLIIIPLAVMLMLVLFSQMGLGTSETFGKATLGSTQYDVSVLYDSDGNQKVNATTLEPLDGLEQITIYEDDIGFAIWYNQTTYWSRGCLYWDVDGEDPVLYNDLGRSSPQGVSVLGVELNTSTVFLAIVTCVIALVSVVGFQLFGSGESETSISVIVIFGGLMAFWSILSLGGLPLLTLVPYLGSLLYVILTLVYSIGCFKAISSGGSE